MRWIAKEPDRWKIGFAFLPVKIGTKWVWLERYLHRDQCLYRQVELYSPEAASALRAGGDA